MAKCNSPKPSGNKCLAWWDVESAVDAREDEDVCAEAQDQQISDGDSEEWELDDFEEDWEPEDTDEELKPDASSATKRKRVEQRESSAEEETCRQLGGGSSDGNPSPKTSATPSLADERWHDVGTPDIVPPQPTFRPQNPPGPQLILNTSYTPLQLFKLFFTNSVLQQVAHNTNLHGSAHHSPPTNRWTDLTLSDILSFMALIVFMGVVKCQSFTDYWRGGDLYSLPFPKRVMTGKKFLLIARALHLSSKAADDTNEQNRGTAAYDRLCKIRPLYEEIREACKRNFHPSQDIAINERMLASKAQTALKQYMKNKPVRWGYKLFVLVDSSTGYTWDFVVYDGRSPSNTGMGLGYDTVMQLLDTQLLGTGYKLFVDNFYTSPALFRDLLQKKIWGCGTIHAKGVDFPKTKENSLVPKSPQGSIRWIRKDSLLFVQWRDTRDVSMCSTLHTAHSGETVSRRVKSVHGKWAVKTIPVPPCVKDYNRCMGGVDLSDALIEYYKVLHKSQKWYKGFFYHFMDIAIVNAYILHKTLAAGNGEKPLSQKAFRETLAKQLAEVGSPSSATPAQPPPAARAHHRPAYISGSSTSGRLKCRQCHKKTPMKCSTCDTPLCLVPERDCYNAWHVARNL
ncbi:piggyBac transposable element-derived protein 4-like [Pholidichthys leucotaenia]